MKTKHIEMLIQACQLAGIPYAEGHNLYNDANESTLDSIFDPPMTAWNKHFWEVPDSIDSPHAAFGLDRLFSGSRTWAIEGMATWIKAFGFEVVKAKLQKQDSWAMAQMDQWHEASEVAQEIAAHTQKEGD